MSESPAENAHAHDKDDLYLAMRDYLHSCTTGSHSRLTAYALKQKYEKISINTIKRFETLVYPCDHNQNVTLLLFANV